MSERDGGPAFPSGITKDSPYGMSLRDWFAGQVMIGVNATEWTDEEMERLAGDAYRLANAMLAERAKEPK